jgi:hypothetical protein
MKARDVSVSVVQYGEELFVMVTMKLPGHSMAKEATDPSGDMTKGVRVNEHSRKEKAAQLQRVLKAVEFPDA